MCVQARARRRFRRGLKRKPQALIKRLRKAVSVEWRELSVQKANTPETERPAPVKTHLRNMIVVPEMIGSVVGVYNGRNFNNVEIKAEMIGHYLGEFSLTYQPVKHNRPGIGATHSSKFIPLKQREGGMLVIGILLCLFVVYRSFLLNWVFYGV